MGIFGKLTNPSQSGLSLLDRAAIFATAAEGDTEGALAYRNSLADRMKRQQQQEFMAQLAGRLQGTAPTYAPTNNDLTVGLGGEGNASTWSPEASINPVRTSNGTPGLNINSPELLPLILGAPPGTNTAPILDVLKAQAPKYSYVNGQRVQLEGAGSGQGPAFIAEMDKGMRPGADGGVEMLPNYDRVVGQIEGARTTAQEGAKAAWRTGPVRVGNTTVELPDSLRIGLLGQAFMRDNPTLAQGQIPQGFGVTPSEATLAADKIRSEGAATKELEAPAKMAAIGEQLQALDTMESLLPDVVAGFGSEVKLQGLRAMAAMGNEEARRQVAATETFLNQGRVLVSQVIKSFGANPTEGERKYAEKMAGADAALNPDTLREGIRLARAKAYRDMQNIGPAGGQSRRPAAPATQGRGYRILSVE